MKSIYSKYENFDEEKALREFKQTLILKFGNSDEITFNQILKALELTPEEKQAFRIPAKGRAKK